MTHHPFMRREGFPETHCAFCGVLAESHGEVAVDKPLRCQTCGYQEGQKVALPTDEFVSLRFYVSDREMLCESCHKEESRHGI